MFTGIIEEVGIIRTIRRCRNSSYLVVSADKIIEDLQIGDSVAVNGACLTVTSLGQKEFTADVMNETLTRSTLGTLTVGSKVNLERAMSVNGRFGGHIVSGHVDGIGKITRLKQDGIAVWYTITTSAEILHYIVEKGSIAVDGISLTVANVGETQFSISVIPHTASKTTLSTKKSGDQVNLENDVIGKYIERLIGAEPSVTKEFLTQHGF